MQNKKYIKFARKNTVEVLSLSRLDEGVREGSPKAAKYKKKDADGDMVEYMVEWPSLTYEQIMQLNRSKAATYNKTGRIPYTCLVNPHTEEEMHAIKGGYSASSLMDAVTEAQKKLTKEYGRGMKRKTVARINAGIMASSRLAAKDDWDGALKLLTKVAPKVQDLPEAFQEKIQEARENIMKSARSRLDAIKEMDPKEAKRAVSRFMGKARNTGLLKEAREFLMSLKES